MFCGEKEPFAIVISGNILGVYIDMYGNYTGLKARYFVMNNTGTDGK